MKTYTLTESELQELLRQQRENVYENLSKAAGYKIADYWKVAIETTPSPLLPTEEVGIKEDETGEMSSFLNSEGEDDYGLYEEDANNDVKIIYETYKTMIDCELKEHLKKWFDYIPSVQSKDLAAVASHSCTIDNSIQQRLKPPHKCIPIAKAAMGEGREWWLGELTERVEEFPVETHCLHLKTPLKDVVFLCNSGDFQQLSVLCRHGLGYAIDETWMQSQLKMSKNAAESLLNSDKNPPVSDTTKAQSMDEPLLPNKKS